MTPDKPLPHDSSLTPRKAPTQGRARNTVASILQATAELVRLHGFDAVGTRLIAERAGISVGSLYQYFPTYESILLAWYEQVAGAVAHKMKLATVEILHKDLDASLVYTFQQLLTAYEEHELVLISMVREVPAIARATKYTSFECLNRASMRIYFSQHHEFDPENTDRHVFFIENIILGNLQRFVAERPAFLPREDLLLHLCRVVRAYLEGCETR